MLIYNNVRQAKFLNRPNRFIANIELDGKQEACHVKNTCRCKELLVPNATVYVQELESSKRKTKDHLISVYKGRRLINIDSQAPNKVFHNWVLETNFFKDVTLIKAEVKYKNSRFDYYIETLNSKIFVEVKGVTLEENSVALFPDAPTERGVRHIYELISSLEEGFEAWIVFIIQMEGIRYFTPNVKTHKEFGVALEEARRRGVNIIALDSIVTKESIKAGDFVKVKL